MQSTIGNSWNRLTADLAALAGQSHRERPADMFALSVEHTHPASPPCWPVSKTHRYDADRREFAAVVRRIGVQAKAIFAKGSRTAGVAALAARFGVTLPTMRDVLAHMETA